MVFLAEAAINTIRGVFRYPKYLFVIPLVILVLYYLIKKDFMQADMRFVSVRKRLKLFMFLSRALIFTLLIIAIASPFTIKEKTVQRDPFIKLIIDNSSSMNIFEMQKVAELKAELEKEIAVEAKYIGNNEESALGDGILQNLKTEENILLATDGQNNKGAQLGDVLLLANKFNASINTMNIPIIKDDLAVSVDGPSRTMKDVENLYQVNVHKVGNVNRYKIKVTVDDKVVVETESTELQHKFVSKFSEGSHRITAVVTPISQSEDHFSQNNVYYKTVRVIKKPRILYYSKSASPMYELLTQVYDVDLTSSLAGVDFNKYYAAVINDIPILDIEGSVSEGNKNNANNEDDRKNVDKLIEFVTDGNGLLVVGGKNSFDKGNYKGSLFESLLPVFVAKPGKKEGEVNVMIAIDISGSTGQESGDATAVDIEKGLAISVIRNLRRDNRVGVIAFNTKSYLIEPIGFKSKKTDIEDKIKKLQYGGGTVIGEAIKTADEMLEKVSGSRNIVLISDGVTTAEVYAIERAIWAGKTGTKIYTVGVGKRTKEWMLEEFSRVSNGIYFRADQTNRFKILFGNTEEIPETERLNIEILDDNHFITKNLAIKKAKIYGFNQVVPKTPAKLVVATTGGDPLITAWNYALGRVVAYTADDGSSWAPAMLTSENSKIVVRSINFAIGVPDRKERNVFDVKDTRINLPTEIFIRTENPPKVETGDANSQQFVFYKIDKETYKAEVVPQKLGFNKVGEVEYAVNYPLEYEALGLNPELGSIVQSSGGKVFEANNAEKIIEEVKSRSKRIIVDRVDIRWYFIAIAIIILLMEITIRKIIEHHKAAKI